MNDKQIRIEEAARALAEERGANNITRTEVCQRAGVAEGAFTTIMEETFESLLFRLELPTTERTERKRAYPAFRLENILAAALTVAINRGYDNITREEVAQEANISPALVSHYFGTTEALRSHIMATAVSRGIVEIVAQGIARRSPTAINAPKELKSQAVSYLARL